MVEYSWSTLNNWLRTLRCRHGILLDIWAFEEFILRVTSTAATGRKFSDRAIVILNWKIIVHWRTNDPHNSLLEKVQSFAVPRCTMMHVESDLQGGGVLCISLGFRVHLAGTSNEGACEQLLFAQQLRHLCALVFILKWSGMFSCEHLFVWH